MQKRNVAHPVSRYTMMETERLLLRPLTYAEVIKYLRNDGSLEKDLELNPTPRYITPELTQAIEEVMLPAVAEENEHMLYSTLWTMILKNEKKMVGDLFFKGPPTVTGEIEIGYGTYDEFQRRGYMTEAVQGMIQWAARQKEVRVIIAETKKANKASIRTLEKCGFRKYAENESSLYWRIPVRG